MRLSLKIQRSIILDPTETFLRSLVKTSEIRRNVTIGDFSRNLIFLDDTWCIECLFLFSFHDTNLESTKKIITVFIIMAKNNGIN